MPATNSARLARRSIHPALIPVPVTLFLGALLTDIAYWRSANLMWADFSDWLLAAAMIMGVVAAIAILVDAVTRRPLMPWPVVIGYLAVFLLGLLNSFVHSRDGWTSVVPTGLALSAVTALVLLLTGWLNWSRPAAHSVQMETAS